MLLALDTATRMISLALHDGTQVCYEHTWRSANNHTIELAPAIDRALQFSGLLPGDLQGIVVAQGPGSFTGLRIGMAAAKGLAAALAIPLIAIPTLDTVAAAIPPFAGDLLAVLQAGRARICAQRYRWRAEAGWEPIGEAAITAWEPLIASVDTPTLVAGEISAQERELLHASGRPLTIAPGASGLRRAGFLAELAWQRLRAGQIADLATLTPLYLHQPGVPHP